MAYFSELNKRAQVELLRPIAREMAGRFGLEPTRIWLLDHGFNTTFRIDSAGAKYALRLNINSKSSIAQIEAETAFVDMLRRANMNVAEPVPLPAGGFIATADGPHGRPIHAVLYTWLSGRLASESPTKDTVFKLGQFTAALHRHVQTWNGPETGAFKRLPDVLHGHPNRLPTKPAFEKTFEAAGQVFAKLERSVRRPIHFDLHLNNAKLFRGQLSVFDFDDAVLAWPVLDSAVSLFHIRQYPNAAELESAYWGGLGTSRLASGLTSEEFETLIASQMLLNANEFMTTSNPRFILMRDRYLATGEKTLARFLATGVFDPGMP